MAAERLMVLYGDDSVEVHYAGGARLLLSPCGSEYMYEEALPAAAHPLQPAESTRQRVPFVLSAYREQILRALDFRNTFSSRPYLPSRIISPERKSREEKMYSVNSLPPDVPGSHYSVSSIITEATKMLQYCYKTKLSLIHNYHLCCWKMVPETDGREMLPVLLDEKVVLGIGRLLVYSDHKVHAVFWDGISLNMVWDFSSCYTKIQVNEDVGWCKLTTPDGVQRLIQIRHPGIYERSADAELEKIQRFNSDRLLQFSFIQQNDWLRAFSDNAVHGILGMWSWAIVIGLRKKSDFTEVTLAGFLASVIDVDHFLLAGSLSLKVSEWIGCPESSPETTSSLFYCDSCCGSDIKAYYAPFQA
ncbi:UNVERIFIED_CONTAM: hypothetical protein H355_007033 [Colinus virginianus]|nr:hypothetical protein H355_007033 [Colinus virginianus]